MINGLHHFGITVSNLDKALMICVNLQMAFMTPPFASAIFVCKGTAAPDLGITMGDIMRGVWPYVFLVMVGLALCVAFPEIILWLPSKMIKLPRKGGRDERGDL